VRKRSAAIARRALFLLLANLQEIADFGEENHFLGWNRRSGRGHFLLALHAVDRFHHQEIAKATIRKSNNVWMKLP
jgi:hypothetical protein